MTVKYFVVASGPYEGDPCMGIIQIGYVGEWVLTMHPSECVWYVPGTFDIND